jgi:cysteine desulfurase family protein (TIGR01976 family)
MPFDVDRIRSCFPSLDSCTAHFDGPGGTQTPRSVYEAIATFLAGPVANRGTITLAERRSESAVNCARQAMADLLGAEPDGIVFGRSMTALTFDFARTLSRDWGPGDEIVVSRLDHDANVRPWVRCAEHCGASVRWIDFDVSNGDLDVTDVESVLSDRTKLVALTGASNLIGTRPNLPAIANCVHSVGALLYVDGVHLTAHTAIDITAIGADFYGCSPYKFFGPHIGVIAAAPALLETMHPDKLLPSTETVPMRFELGTLPYELLVAVTAAVDFIAGMVDSEGSRRERIIASMHAAEEYEDSLSHRLREGLKETPGVTVYSNARSKTPTDLFSIHGVSSKEAYACFAKRNINAPAGSFYAIEASRHLGLGDDGAIRAGISPYAIHAFPSFIFVTF